MNFKQVFLLIWPFILLMACSDKKNKKSNDDKKAEMMAAEISFSKFSELNGTRKALMEYIDSEGVLLRPNIMPLVGADAIDFISQANDTAYTMIWQPKGGNIAESGELGYTFGIYSITPKYKDSIMQGTYVNVWKKQPDGSWRLLLDSGNEGIDIEQ